MTILHFLTQSFRGRRLAVALCTLALGGAAAAQTASSAFDAGSDGWTPFPSGATDLEFQASGGNPGGYISALDIDNAWAYVSAPAAYLAFDAYGGALSFDLFAVTSDPVSFPLEYGVRVGLVGDGLVLINEAEDPPTSSWSNYAFALHEAAGWRVFSTLGQDYSDTAPVPTAAQMRAVTANLSGLYIAADYTDGTFQLGQTDLTSIDNVLLEAGTDADGDGIPDSADNCRLVANPDQRDTNGDGFGNLCDPDINNDGIVNAIDLGLFKLVFFTADADSDFNGDGIVNIIDLGVLKAYFFLPPGPGAP